MRYLILITLVYLLSGPIGAFANTSNEDINHLTFQNQVQKLVDDFYAEKMLFPPNDFSPVDDCHPTRPNCIDVACSKMAGYKCDELSEIQEVGRACRGNYNGLCLQTVCSKMPSYRCDELSEIRQLAPACVGNIDGSCVESVCARLPSYHCDEVSELTEVAQVCGGQ